MKKGSRSTLNAMHHHKCSFPIKAKRWKHQVWKWYFIIAILLDHNTQYSYLDIIQFQDLHNINIFDLSIETQVKPDSHKIILNFFKKKITIKCWLQVWMLLLMNVHYWVLTNKHNYSCVVMVDMMANIEYYLSDYIMI